ncbi:MAG: hypothetical protein ACTSRI_11030 [Promethearchaeota archaeon]
MENKKWMIVCLIGGILMIISSVVGSVSFFALIFGILTNYVGADVAVILSIVLQIFGYIAMGGGISVLIGTLLIMIDQYKVGKFIIGLGAGMGLISLIIFLITSILSGALINDITGLVVGIINGSYGFAGVLLTILARTKLKKKKNKEKEQEQG